MKYNILVAFSLVAATFGAQAAAPEVKESLTLDSPVAKSIIQFISLKTEYPKNPSLTLKSVDLLTDDTYSVQWNRATNALNGVKLSGYQQTFTKSGQLWVPGTLSAPFLVSWTIKAPGK
jgi:hypothetical protein